APRRLAILGGVSGGGKSLDQAGLEDAYRITRQAYRLEGAADRLRIGADAGATEMLQ
ncbi:MAG: hypothetical protein HUU20_28795, partial [Pirellulales bacterium]|nr:hypothetical protein [Pirellulales bacterium]